MASRHEPKARDLKFLTRIKMRTNLILIFVNLALIGAIVWLSIRVSSKKENFRAETGPRFGSMSGFNAAVMNRAPIKMYVPQRGTSKGYPYDAVTLPYDPVYAHSMPSPSDIRA